MKEKDIRSILAEKLRQFRTKSGLTAKQVGEIVDKSAKTVSGWEHGRGQPDADMLFKLCDVYGIYSINAFYDKDDDGAAPSVSFPTLTKEESALLKDFREVDDHGRRVVLLLLDEELKRAQSMNEKPKQEMIVYNFPAAAGVPMWAEDDSYERHTFTTSQVPIGADFGIRISGDSMEPTIPAGTIVFVRKVPELRNGDIGIFMLDDEAVCKRFTMDQRGIVLQSDNEAYEPLVINGYQRFTVTGKVLGYK